MLKLLLTAQAIAILASSCTAQKPIGEETQLFAGGDAFNVRSGGDNMANDNFSDALIGNFDGKPGWPDFPRRWKIFTNEYAKDGGIQLGIKLDAFGSEVESTTKVMFGRMRQTRLWVLMHSPTLDAQLTKADGDLIYFDAREEYKMVAICMYSVYLNTTAETLGKITIQGTGALASARFKQETEITVSSEFMKVELGDSLLSWRDRCESLFTDKIQDSVDRDLANSAKNMIYHTQMNQCVIPTKKEDRFLSDGRPGDRSCEADHRKALPGVEAYSTPRCVHQAGLAENVGLCRIFAAKDTACRLYQTPDGTVSGVPTTDAKLVSSGMFEYTCDARQGLTCQVAETGGWFRSWNSPYSFWKGKCARTL